MDLFEDFVDPEKVKEQEAQIEKIKKASSTGKISLKNEQNFTEFANVTAQQLLESGNKALTITFLKSLLDNLYEGFTSIDFDVFFYLFRIFRESVQCFTIISRKRKNRKHQRRKVNLL